MGANPGAISWHEVRRMAAKVAGKLARTMHAPAPFDDGGVPVIWRLRPD